MAQLTKKIVLFSVLISFLFLVGISFAITDITLPVPEKEGETLLKISANNVLPSNGTISVSSKQLTVKMENIKAGKDFFVGINKDLAQDISKISTTSQTQKNPPFDYAADNFASGAIFKVENLDSSTTKSFSINNWDGAKPIKVNVCQDKNDDKDCSENDEKTSVSISFKTFGNASCNTIQSCLATLGKKIAFELEK